MVGRRSADDLPVSRPMSYLIEPLFIGRCVGRSSADWPIVKFFESVRYIVFNVIASVGRQNDVYRPIKIQNSYRPTVFFNVIAA